MLMLAFLCSGREGLAIECLRIADEFGESAKRPPKKLQQFATKHQPLHYVKYKADFAEEKSCDFNRGMIGVYCQDGWTRAYS
jgi:hypothetical protein